MKTISNIISKHFTAIVTESNDLISFESCACGPNNYAVFYHSNEFCSNFVRLIVSKGFECKISFDGLFYRYHIVVYYY